ncbi:TonB family protein [Alishewanella tabrizica]|uniref:Protein TonB n=1 Tax=Alishewanella tabrizica TaxID=671278 RepID=A0ABQ2WSA7_9ALTE|nr:TonB family protein [Alishewanella tabrizica]GGW65846.1 protein TonB [Alishewanella tabrizica]
MINWLWQSTLWLSTFSVILLLSHPILLRYLGARATYSLWLLLPCALLLPLLPSLPSNRSTLVMQQLLISPETLSNIAGKGNTIFPILVMWLVGFCCVVAWCLFSYMALIRQLQSAHSFKIGKLRCYRQHNTGPAIFGFLRPSVLIPSDFKQRFTKKERHLILQHERAHWQAGDLHINLFALLLLAVFWYSPMSWLAYRRFRADQELACDARVLQHQTPTVLVCYANALLAAMQSVSSAAQTNLLSPHYGATKHMTERLNNLTRQKGLHKQPLILSLSIMILLAMSLQPSTATQTANSATLTEEMVTPIVRIAPRYPASAAQQGITGWVQLGYTLDSNGMVEQPKVLAAHPEGVFNEEALRAVSKWRYSPEHAGKSITVELKFALDNTTNK